MRTMKFRAWDSKNKKFPLGLTGFHIIGECTVFDLVNQYRLEEALELEITQYTGLTDKNGKELYEGDIVEWTGKFIAEVFWCEEDAAFQIKSKTGGAFLNYLYLQNFQIIGNIYENPELRPKQKMNG